MSPESSHLTIPKRKDDLNSNGRSGHDTVAYQQRLKGIMEWHISLVTGYEVCAEFMAGCGMLSLSHRSCRNGYHI